MPRSVGDLLVGRAAHEHEEHFELALGQPGGQLARSLPHPVAGGSEHRVDSFRVEPPLFGLTHQLGLCRRRIERRPVRPRLAHGRVAVGGGEDAGGLIECRPAGAAVVAGPVEPLVV